MASLLLLAEPSFSVNLLAESVRQLGYSVVVASPTDDFSALSFDSFLIQLTASSINEIPKLRVCYPGKPIIVLTETGQEEMTIAALQAGAESFIHQANLPRDIGDTLSEVLHTSTSQLKQTMFLKRLTGLTHEYTLENDSEFIGPIVAQAEVLLHQFKLFDESDRMRIGVAIHEALVNAMIHGNLEISSSLKNDNWDDYHRLVAERKQQKPYAERRVKVQLQAEKGRLFRVVIRDEGPGYDVSAVPDPTDDEGCENCSGRGMMFIRAFFDEVHHNARGNEITMIKLVAGSTL